MHNLLEKIRKILNGEADITAAQKLQWLLGVIGVVHLIMVFMFYAFDVWFLVLYNIFVVIYYLGVWQWARKGETVRGYVATFLEILIQILLGSHLVGFGSGFFLYGIGLIPLFYFLASEDIRSGSIRLVMRASIGTLVMGIFLIITYLLTTHFEPEYEISAGQISILFQFNLTLVVLMQAFMSHMFLVNQKRMYQSLESENEKLDLEASIDPLTGLYNRRAMEVMLEQAMEKAKTKGTRFGLLMCDIDDFKRINDTFGHDRGDDALLSVAAIMRGTVREGDQICRWGGEEFLILVNGDLNATVSAGERIREKVQGMVIPDEKGVIEFTITMGAVTYMPGFNMDTHIEMADRRLYYGKRHGKNQVVSGDHD